MNVVVLFASPRPQGVTAAMTEEFLSLIRADADRIDTASLCAAPCDGCGACDRGRCVHDDLDGVFARLAKADLIVAASPVYFYTFPSGMKAFVDRLQPYYLQPLPREKKGFGALLCCAGQSGSVAFDLMRRQTRRVFECLNVEYAGDVCKGYTDREPSLTARDRDSLKNLAGSIAKNIL